MPLFPREQSGEPDKQRHIPDWIDRRPDGRKILANLDEQRRHFFSVRQSPTTVQSFFCLLTSCHRAFRYRVGIK